MKNPIKMTILDGYTLNPGDLSWDGLENLGKLTVYPRTTPEETLERAKDSPILFTNKTLLNEEILRSLPKLKYIGVLATGMNVVDLEVAKELGITVTNIPAYSSYSVAQLTFALLLELCHNTCLHVESVKKGDWVKSIDFCYQLTPLIELRGKTFGILGLGEIGNQCAKIAAAFGMNILYTSRTPKNPQDFPDYQQVDLETLFSQSDVLSLNCPLTTETQEIINHNTLSKMKPSAILINTGRGTLVNESDLSQALKSNIIAGYACDVLSIEPPEVNNPLLTAPNCIITPHIAWKTKEARQRLMEVAVANVKKFISKTYTPLKNNESHN